MFSLILRQFVLVGLGLLLMQTQANPTAPAGWEDVGALISSILAEGGTLGLYSWGASALLISYLQKRRGKPMIDSEKRNLSIAVSGVTIIVAYIGGVILGIIVFDGNSLLKAIRIFATEVGFAKGLHAATREAQTRFGIGGHARARVVRR